jgi:hypothetical protein
MDDSMLALLESAAIERAEVERIREQARYDRMRSGPYLEPDGCGGQWVVIPSDWYDEEAKGFWKAIGCRFLPREKSWVRPVALPYEYETYSPRQWLVSIRKRFFEFHGAKLKEMEEQLWKKSKVSCPASSFATQRTTMR